MESTTADMDLDHSSKSMSTACLKQMYMELPTLGNDEFERKYRRKKPTNILNPAAFVLDIKYWILLNGEFLTNAQYRVQSYIFVLCFFVSLVALVLAFIFSGLPWVPTQNEKLQYWIRHDALYKVNVGFAVCCAAGLAVFSYNIVRHIILCQALQKSGERIWAPNRKRIAMFALCQLIAQDINVFFWLLQNAYVLGKRCSWFDPFVNGCTLVQWSCLNFIFTLDMIWADGMTPWLDKDGKPETTLPGRKSWRFTPDPTVMDQPLSWRHVRKVLVGLFFQAIIFFYAFWIGIKKGIGPAVLNHVRFAQQALGAPACYKEESYVCALDPPYLLAVWSWVLLVFVHALMVFRYIERAQDKLQAAGPYLLWERQYKMVKMLEASCGWITMMGLASTTALFINKLICCSTILVPWMGVLPLQVTTSIIVCSNAFYYFPRPAEQSDIVIQGWLRELVWRAEDLPQLRKSMIENLPDSKEVLLREPVFCFDAAAKLLAWSDLVYTFEDNMHAKDTEDDSTSRSGWGQFCPCCSEKEQNEPKEDESANATTIHLPGLNAGPAQEYAQELPAADPLPGHLHPKAQEMQRMGGEASKRPGPSLSEANKFSFAGRSLTRRTSDRSGVSDVGIVSLKLSEDGYLQQEGTDVKIEIAEGVASEAGLGLAMRLFDLQGFEILYEEKLQTKVLLGWSQESIVLAFRGTATATNAWTDLKVARKHHHLLKSGRWWSEGRPLVHGGFLQSWRSSDLHATVVARVREILGESPKQRQDFKIYVTGHSLGGALATLAALEIAKEEDLPGVKCITFGAPRTGNHAFARQYNELVPDTWHVINDRDAVPRMGKFFFLFKRPGHRVLINKSGDCRVRPDSVQVSLHKEGFSVKAHFLRSYRKALGAVLKCQLIPVRSRSGGREAFEAFAADKDLCALGRYLGLDMKQLLELTHTEIKMRRRNSCSTSPLRKFQLIKFTVRSVKFLLGEPFAEGLRSLIFTVARSFSSAKKQPKAARQWETRERNFPEL